MLDKLSEIDFTRITDPYPREAVSLCLNVIESQHKEIQELKSSFQALKDEFAKFKGEDGTPEFKAKKENKDISSPPVDKKPRGGGVKKGNKPSIAIDKTVVCQVDRHTLPADAVLKGYDTLIQQDIVFKRENTQYLVEVWYSATDGKTYRGDAHANGYQGYFGNSLRSFCVVMHHDIDVTHSKLYRIFKYLGLCVSAGSIQNILSQNPHMWTKEKVDILHAGLMAPYIQTDITACIVAGILHRTHILCSPHFAVFCTLASKSRRHVLYALQGQPQSGLMMCYNDTTLEYLNHFKVSKSDIAALQALFEHLEPLTELEFQQMLHGYMPALACKTTTFNWVCDAFAFGYYHQQTLFPVAKILVSDAAPEYKLVAPNHGLCWIHDARDYNKLTPLLEPHKQELAQFKERYWNFYDALSDYKQEPTPELKQEIEHKFDTLFVANTPYWDLNKVIEQTRADKQKLLTVLQYPQIPLHNNAAELAARYVVQKRDICLHTITKLGTQLKDAFMSIIYTCRLLGINAFSYIMDRIAGTNEFYLPDVVRTNINSS